jgi:hypothetical protein
MRCHLCGQNVHVNPDVRGPKVVLCAACFIVARVQGPWWEAIAGRGWMPLPMGREPAGSMGRDAAAGRLDAVRVRGAEAWQR